MGSEMCIRDRFGAGARGLKVVDILILGDYSLVVSFVFSAPFMR